MFTNDDRMAALQKAPIAVGELYGSEALTKIIGGLRKKHTISNEMFVDVVGDIILGLYPKQMLMSLLIEQLNLSEKIAGDIVSELSSFLDAIPSTTSPTVKQTDKTAQQQEIKTQVAVAPTPEGSSAKPLTREELMQALEPRQATGSNLEAMRQKLEHAANQKPGEHEAIEKQNETNLGT